MVDFSSTVLFGHCIPLRVWRQCLLSVFVWPATGMAGTGEELTSKSQQTGPDTEVWGEIH